MLLFQIILLGVVKGLGEFLPIGGAGPISLVPRLSGWSDQSAAIDLACQLGALAALLLYFWRDLARLAGGRWAGRILAGSLPAILLGGLLQYLVSDRLGSLVQIADTTIALALLLVAVDRLSAGRRRAEELSLGQAMTLGVAQALAVLPGSGRAAIAIIVGRLLGYERREAARLAFLFSIPCLGAIALADAFRLLRGGAQVDLPSTLHDALLVALVTALASLAAIAFLMRWLKSAGFALFAGYRLVIGALLFYAAYGGVL